MEKSTLQKHRPVAIWLYIGAAWILIQAVLGGITRLTGSGLSITEWDPIMGALPPMNDAAWQKAFEGYQKIAQYKYLNSHFTLADFKSIFFWEWAHREWARALGIVFIVPFIYFVLTRKIDRSMIRPMIIVFLLGALQAVVGWVMVQSGLNETDLYVNHIRLAGHFIAALLLLVYLLWFGLRLSVPVKQILPVPALRRLNGLLLVLLTLQLTYGAFMAGLHAALSANTWPDINGAWLPGGMFTQGSFMNDITCNPITVQFIHRNLAYLITLLVVGWWWKASATPHHSLLHRARYLPLVLVLLQVLLGVLTLLCSRTEIPIHWAILHQFTGMLLLLALVWTFFLSGGKEAALK
jgi:heme a synthase